MIASASMRTFTSTVAVRNVWILQLIFLCASCLLLLKFAQNFSFTFAHKYQKLLIVITFGALLITRFFTRPGINAHNWIYIGPISIQPSEFAKVVVMILIANSLGGLPEVPWANVKEKLKQISLKDQLQRILSLIWGPVVSVVLFILIVLLYQDDLGSAVVMLFIALFMLLMAEHPFLGKAQRWLIVVVMGAFLVVGFIISPVGAAWLDSTSFADNYMVKRITSIYYLFRPENIDNTSFQQVKGLISFAYGGLNGVGWGKSIQKYGYLPAAETDYILAIVVEELGIWGFLGITIGYMILIMTLFLYAMRVESAKGRLFLIGVMAYLFVHYLFNVGGVSAILPLTGIPLLLISKGGSSQMALFIAIGISQNIIARDNTLKLKRKKVVK